MEAMTLERAQARANEIEDAICRGKMDVYQVFTQMRQLIPSAHLAQPAQAVDVGAIREVIVRLNEIVEMADRDPDEFYSFDLDEQADKLTRALSGEKAGPAGDGMRLVPVEPTEAMKEAAERWWQTFESGDVTESIWDAYLGAAPSAEASPWPNLHADARIGGTVFRKGVSAEIVVNRAIREQEWRLAFDAAARPLPASPTPDKEGA